MTNETSALPAAAGGTVTIGGELTVNRLGYGAMRLTGPGVWGPPADRQNAVSVLRRSVELGVDFIDTADAYGPAVSEELIHEALHPYEGVTIATKGGYVRGGPGEWQALGRPDYLRQCVELSLRRLGVEAIDLYQLHRIDVNVPLAEQLGVLKELRTEGKIRHVGLSAVTVAQVEQARNLIEVASVQNSYSVLHRSHDSVVDYCAAEGMAFIPYFPMGGGDLTGADGPLGTAAKESGATPAQIALAWLLQRAPVVLPIPGTSAIGHLEENVAAASVALPAELIRTLSDLG
ncbi:MAG TPA: aldo/keto reductase [Mycobacteriales bacterium]|nr:aldo/keto reductase [Mycobacteriales bacterium]